MRAHELVGSAEEGLKTGFKQQILGIWQKVKKLAQGYRALDGIITTRRTCAVCNFQRCSDVLSEVSR